MSHVVVCPTVSQIQFQQYVLGVWPNTNSWYVIASIRRVRRLKLTRYMHVCMYAIVVVATCVISMNVNIIAISIFFFVFFVVTRFYSHRKWVGNSEIILKVNSSVKSCFQFQHCTWYFWGIANVTCLARERALRLRLTCVHTHSTYIHVKWRNGNCSWQPWV